MNNRKIEITGQTQATVKTNKETIKLSLLITKATTTPLWGLDWMQRQGIYMNTENNGRQIQNAQVDETERKTVELKNDFKNLFYHNRETKDLLVKIKNERRSTSKTTKRSTDTVTVTRTSSRKIKTNDRTRLFGKSNRKNRDLLCKSGSNNSEKRQVNKTCPGSRKFNEITIKRKTQLPNREELISRISRNISEGEDGEVLAAKLDFDFA